MAPNDSIFFVRVFPRGFGGDAVLPRQIAFQAWACCSLDVGSGFRRGCRQSNRTTGCEGYHHCPNAQRRIDLHRNRVPSGVLSCCPYTQSTASRDSAVIYDRNGGVRPAILDDRWVGSGKPIFLSGIVRASVARRRAALGGVRVCSDVVGQTAWYAIPHLPDVGRPGLRALLV